MDDLTTATATLLHDALARTAPYGPLAGPFVALVAGLAALAAFLGDDRLVSRVIEAARWTIWAVFLGLPLWLGLLAFGYL